MYATIRPQPWSSGAPRSGDRITLVSTACGRTIMLGRRSKPDGFEWHRYIRTTVRLRREQRRERVLEARRAAAQQASAAGVALAQGSRAAGAAALTGARAGFGVAGLAAQAVWNFIATVAVLAGRKLAILAQPVIAALARPNVGGPIALA